jgi:hypothetical protein
MKMYVHLWYLVEFLLNDKCVRQNLKRKSEHSLVFNTIFLKSIRLSVNVEKYGRTRQTEVAVCLLWKMHNACWIHKATNTHSQYLILDAFSTATLVTRTRLIFTFYLHCLSCLSLVHLFADKVRHIILAKKCELVCFNVPTVTFILIHHIKIWLIDADVFSEILPVRLEISRAKVGYCPTCCCCWIFTFKISETFVNDNERRWPYCEADVVQLGKRCPVVYKSLQPLP